MIALAPRLEVISSISVGVDNCDLPLLERRGILLCNTPGVLTETTADTIFALIMATNRRLVELALHGREGCWTRNIDESPFGWDVHGKTLGIVGFGRIGQALARRAALGFGMPVLYHSPFPSKSPNSPAGCATRRWTCFWALPHIGSATHETRHAMAELATSNLLDALAVQRPAATVA